jgi:hypothetical protein
MQPRRPPDASRWAFAYVAVIVSLVCAGIGMLASTSSAFGHAATLDAANPAASARRGLGAPDVAVLRVDGYGLQIRSLPRHLGKPEQVSLRLLHDGTPVGRARVRYTFSMPDMPAMHGLSGMLRSVAAGTYARMSPALTVGRWQLRLDVAVPHQAPFQASFVYRIVT